MRLSYPFLRRFGMGAHLALIIGLSAVPAGFLVARFIHAHQQDAIAEAEQWTRAAAKYAAAQHRTQIASTQALLVANSQQVRNQTVSDDQCVESVDTSYKVWLIASAKLSCGESGELPLTDESMKKIVEQAPQQGFSIIGPIEAPGGDLTLFGVHGSRADDGTTWLVVRSVDLSWMPVFSEGRSEFSNYVVMEYDDDGRVFERFSADGTDLTEIELPLFTAGRYDSKAIERGDASSMTMEDIDGVKRIFGIAPLPEARATVVVAVSHASIVSAAQRELIGTLALFGAVIAISTFLAWLIIERKILRAVRKLRDAAVAMTNGEDGRVVEIVDAPYELQQLAVAFNEMTAKLQHQALHDQLTGLPNRRSITQRMELLQRDRTAFSVLAVDLDGFKPVNDTYGHVVGDMVLTEVARRLENCLPHDVTIGRTGGDEFVALIPAESSDAASNKRAVVIAQIFLDQIRQPIKVKSGELVKIGGCIGIACWPQGDATPEDVFRHADSELYRAKEAGKNRYSVYKPKPGATRAA
ncbi:diguanylate cyclase [Microbaculum marinum]|uniref:Diguanylate cyclase n=1 Tax=Microbaculum marinum TaxID=1764581 RepID=A0AAW9RSL9_9HYPH